MSFFHIDYKPITDKLPKSLVKRSYDRLLCLKHNPITLNQISLESCQSLVGVNILICCGTTAIINY